MSRRRKILIALAIVAVVGAAIAWRLLIEPGAMAFAGKGSPLADYRGPDPTGVPAGLRNTDLITRGRYLATAADCEVCHTTEGGKPYAGGRAFKTPFGTLYSPNITADVRTGIGGWSDAEFVRAVHKGIAKDGSRLYPAFPYESYALITDADVLAIKAYLFSLPQAQATPPANSLGFPFNQRQLMAVWSLLYRPNHRFEPVAARDAQWNRGAYLVEALAHCGDCHTPRNLAQGLNNRRKFTGAVTQGWRAYNITSHKDSGIGAWTDSEIQQYLAQGHAVGRGTAGGPMAEAVDASLSKLDPTDIAAMAAYLRTIPALATPGLPAPRTSIASAMPKEGVAAGDPRGKRVFQEACASCHSWTGVSPLTPFATLTGTRAVNDTSAVNIAHTVLLGVSRKTDHGIIYMPAFAASHSDAEIAAVANYVTARFGAKGSDITPKQVAQLRQQ